MTRHAFQWAERPPNILGVAAAVYAAKKSIAASARLMQPTALPRTGRNLIDFSPVKIPPAMRPFVLII